MQTWTFCWAVTGLRIEHTGRPKGGPDDPAKKPHGKRYIFGIEQLRDAIEAAEEALGRRASILERFRAMVYFIDHDAFADVNILLGKSKPMN